MHNQRNSYYDNEATAEELLKGVIDAEEYSRGKPALSLQETAQSFDIQL